VRCANSIALNEPTGLRPENQDPIGLRDPGAQLSETEYEVTVTAEAGEISAVDRFTLRNEGTRYAGLRLDRRDV
jgi:hypothetical protein